MSVTMRLPAAAQVRYRTGVVRPDSDALEYGGNLSDWRVAYSLAGRDGGPVVAVLGGVSAHRWVASGGGRPGWWDAVVGSGRTVDLDQYRVLSIDWLGAPGGSVRITPGAGETIVTPRDQAKALASVVDELELHTLHGAIGASYGGAVALAFAADFADLGNGALVIGATHASHPLATAVRSIQRKIVRRSPEEREGLALSRALAITTYGSSADWQRRFGGRALTGQGTVRFEFEDWLEQCGHEFARRWTADEYVCMSLSLDLHSIDPRDIRAPVTLLSIEPDFVAPRWQMEELAAAVAGPCRLIRLDSIHGHDVFLDDPDAIAPVIREFLTTPGLRS